MLGSRIGAVSVSVLSLVVGVLLLVVACTGSGTRPASSAARLPTTWPYMDRWAGWVYRDGEGDEVVCGVPPIVELSAGSVECGCLVQLHIHVWEQRPDSPRPQYLVAARVYDSCGRYDQLFAKLGDGRVHEPEFAQVLTDAARLADRAVLLRESRGQRLSGCTAFRPAALRQLAIHVPEAERTSR